MALSLERPFTGRILEKLLGFKYRYIVSETWFGNPDDFIVFAASIDRHKRTVMHEDHFRYRRLKNVFMVVSLLRIITSIKFLHRETFVSRLKQHSTNSLLPPEEKRRFVSSDAADLRGNEDLGEDGSHF